MKDESAKVFGVHLFFFGMGLFLATQIKQFNVPYIAAGIMGVGLFLLFVAKQSFKLFGNAMKEISENL